MDHWVEIVVTLHRDVGEESTTSDFCLWQDSAATIGRLSAELLESFPEPIGRLYPTFRIRYKSVAPRMLRYLRPRQEVTR